MLIFILILCMVAVFTVGWRLACLLDIAQPTDADWFSISVHIAIVAVLLFVVGSILDKVLP